MIKFRVGEINIDQVGRVKKKKKKEQRKEVKKEWKVKEVIGLGYTFNSSAGHPPGVLKIEGERRDICERALFKQTLSKESGKYGSKYPAPYKSMIFDVQIMPSGIYGILP